MSRVQGLGSRFTPALPLEHRRVEGSGSIPNDTSYGNNRSKNTNNDDKVNNTKYDSSRPKITNNDNSAFNANDDSDGLVPSEQDAIYHE